MVGGVRRWLRGGQSPNEVLESVALICLKLCDLHFCDGFGAEIVIVIATDVCASCRSGLNAMTWSGGGRKIWSEIGVAYDLGSTCAFFAIGLCRCDFRCRVGADGLFRDGSRSVLTAVMTFPCFPPASVYRGRGPCFCCDAFDRGSLATALRAYVCSYACHCALYHLYGGETVRNVVPPHHSEQASSAPLPSSLS